MDWAEPAGGRSIIVRCTFPGRECSTTIFPRPGWTQTTFQREAQNMNMNVASPMRSRKVVKDEEWGSEEGLR